MSAADLSLRTFHDQLAARTPTPGGGGAAALVASIGTALAAMATRYTSGKRWREAESEANDLTDRLAIASEGLLALIDEDAEAFADLKRTWSGEDLSDDERAAITLRAQLVPLRLLETCAELAAAMVDFAPRCNRNLVSDAVAAVHLLAGGGRAAWQTLLINQPTADQRERGACALASLATSDTWALEPDLDAC